MLGRVGWGWVGWGRVGSEPYNLKSQRESQPYIVPFVQIQMIP